MRDITEWAICRLDCGKQFFISHINAHTAIAIDYIDRDCWIVGGKLLSEQNKNSFYFDIKVTDETNTKDEKAQYIKEAFAGFEKILGSLHEESYVYVADVRATAYGYGGKTQEYRYHQ